MLSFFKRKKMPRRHLFLSLMFLFASACSLRLPSRNSIEHDIVPGRGLYYGVDGRRIVRRAMAYDAECIVVDDAMRRLVSIPDKNKTVILPDVPCLIFAITVTNRTLRPLRIKSLRMRWERSDQEALSRDQFAQVLHSYGYRRDAAIVYQFRRIIYDDFSFSKIARHSVGYDFDFIAPGDQVLFFRAFEYPPVRAKKLKVTLSVLDIFEEKTVDFDFEQIEMLNERR